MLVPHHLNPPPPPPHLGKEIYSQGLSRVLVTIGNYQNTPFLGFLGKSSLDYAQRSPFPRKWECACDPLLHSSEGAG